MQINDEKTSFCCILQCDQTCWLAKALYFSVWECRVQSLITAGTLELCSVFGISRMSFLPTNRNQQKYYKTTDEPRELTCDDLAFVSQYTGKSPDDLRQHVINVWRTTKEQVRISSVDRHFPLQTVYTCFSHLRVLLISHCVASVDLGIQVHPRLLFLASLCPAPPSLSSCFCSSQAEIL